MPQYTVIQTVLSARVIGGSLNGAKDLERIINTQASKGYRLHTLTSVSANGNAMVRDGKVQVIIVFEKI